MKPMGTFLDFTRLYVYVHWMFFHFFFLVNGLLAKSTILLNDGEYCTFGQITKLIILDIVTFFCFYMVHLSEYNSKWTVFLFYAVM